MSHYFRTDKTLPQQPSKARFARLMADALRRAGETIRFRYDPDRFCLEGPGSHDTINLWRAYQQYCTAPKGQREEVLRCWVRG